MASVETDVFQSDGSNLANPSCRLLPVARTCAIGSVPPQNECKRIRYPKRLFLAPVPHSFTSGETSAFDLFTRRMNNAVQPKKQQFHPIGSQETVKIVLLWVTYPLALMLEQHATGEGGDGVKSGTSLTLPQCSKREYIALNTIHTN